MRLNDWGWRLDLEAHRLFDFDGRTVINDGCPWYKDTDSVKRMVNKFYGAEAFGIKEDTKMNVAQDMKNEEKKNNARRDIMNKLKVGDKICTSANMTTPMEIFAFDYVHLRVGLKHRISAEGYEKVSRFWADPLTITDPDVRVKVSYTDYHALMREQKKANRIPSPKRIIVNEDSKVAVVMWDDGTKTIVKCSDADTYDPYAAYCAAFAKKCYGTNSKLKKTIEKLTVYQEKKKKDKTPAHLLPSIEEAAKSFNDVVKRFYGTD